jgi:hypothetical protein
VLTPSIATASSTSATSRGSSSRACRCPSSSAAASQSFWRDLRAAMPVWDELIRGFNADTGLAAPAS